MASSSTLGLGHHIRVVCSITTHENFFRLASELAEDAAPRGGPLLAAPPIMKILPRDSDVLGAALLLGILLLTGIRALVM
jgi:hypothetical protein